MDLDVDTVLVRGTDKVAIDEPAEPQGRLSLLVTSERHIATYPLPASGEVTIGRSPKAHISIDDPSISRNHATLVTGDSLAIRDLGSANGTTVDGRRIPPNAAVEIAPGQPIILGNVTVLVQRRSTPLRPRRLWTHDYFEVRLEEECSRARRNGIAFTVMRVRCENIASVQDALVELVRLSDVVGEYGPGEYEVLLVDTSPELADAAVKRFMADLSSRGLTVDVGIACFPRDGSNPDELMAHAGRQVRPLAVDRPAGAAFVVRDPAMEELYRLAARIATGNISVLILGETGAGKEVLAAHVHHSSPRASKPYLKLNCAALTETLLESELFGHERGAFTGAMKDKPGLIETADGGTIFLDEIGELPMSLQVKLLRVLEERMVMRVGSVKPRKIDVRFIAATNRDLESEIAHNRFRQDLFYRLNGVTLVIPPLRERPREIAALSELFITQSAKQVGLAVPPALSREALQALERYAWPGNIRELRNVIERAVLLCGTGTITPAHLPLEKLRVSFSPTAPLAKAPAALDTSARVDFEDIVGPGERAEKERIITALQQCTGNQTKAARLLGISRRTLINKLERYGIERPRKRSDVGEGPDDD